MLYIVRLQNNHLPLPVNSYDMDLNTPIALFYMHFGDSGRYFRWRRRCLCFYRQRHLFLFTSRSLAVLIKCRLHRYGAVGRGKSISARLSPIVGSTRWDFSESIPLATPVASSGQFRRIFSTRSGIFTKSGWIASSLWLLKGICLKG